MYTAMKLTLVLYLSFTRLRHAHGRNYDDLPYFLFPEDTTTDSRCGGDPYFNIRTGPKHAVQTHNIDVYNKVTISYGTPLRVECIGADATRLAIMKNGVNLKTESWSKLSILWATRNPDIQNSTFVCTDTETACEQVAIIIVTPALEVISPDIKVYSSEYIFRYGTPMTVLCSGSAASRLSMTKDGEKVPAMNENHNTIKWTIEKPDLQISEIVCTDIDTFINDSVVITIEPLLYVQSNETTLKLLHSFIPTRYWQSTYGNPIEIICTGPRAVKLISPEENNRELLAQSVNETTVKLLIRNLKIGESIFGCLDSEVSDYTDMSTVAVIVIPRMEVLSPNVRRVDDKYEVKYRDPVEIICSSPRVELPNVKENSDADIYRVNDTTVKWIMNSPKLNHVYKYYCSAEETVARVEIIIEALPEAMGFHCLSHNLQYLNCTWTAPSDRINYTLYTENGNHTICTRERSGEKSRFCVWHKTDHPSYSNEIKVLSLLMLSCNGIGCCNHSFFIDHISIVRPAPPQKIWVSDTNSRGVLLHWRLSHVDLGGKRFWTDTDFHHKVQYWYSGIVQPLEVNSSLVSCSLFDHCNMVLELPCPGLFYQVSIYHKLKRAVGEDYWSDPRSVTFRMPDTNDNTEEDSTCYLKPEETAEVVTYFVQKLQHEVRLEMPQIRKELKSLQEKRANIHAYFEKTKTVKGELKNK